MVTKMHIPTFSPLLLLLVITAVLAIIDSATRLRGRRGVGVLAVIELIVGVLMILSVFIALPGILANNILEIVLLVVVILLLVFRGSVRRGFVGVTVITLVLDLALLLFGLGWLHIPGIN
jgi:uncharacterized membrane protein